VPAPLADRAFPHNGHDLLVRVARRTKVQHEEASPRCSTWVWSVYALTLDGSLRHLKDKEKIYVSVAALPHSLLNWGGQQVARAGHQQCAVEMPSQLFHARQTVVQHLVQMYV
jgi:hypothetical protein